MKYYFAVIFPLVFLLGNCLSFSLFPLARSVKVATAPAGARVEVFDERELIAEFTTPGRFYLFKDRNVTMIISKDGYRTETADVRFKYSPVRAFVTAITGYACLMVPAGVDLLTGAIRVPTKQVHTIELQPLKEGEREIHIDVRLERDDLITVSTNAK